MAENICFLLLNLFTEGHPDKIADQISDAVLDAIIEKDPTARVACETLVTTGLVHVVGEISTHTYVDIPRIVRDTIREIGYTRAKFGLIVILVVYLYPSMNNLRISPWVLMKHLNQKMAMVKCLINRCW